jgi:ribonucleoside-diphosphate reductase alpha chain
MAGTPVVLTLDLETAKRLLGKQAKGTLYNLLESAIATAQRADHRAPPAEPPRHRLPDDRESTTHKFSIGDKRFYLTVGLYENGSAGEVFIDSKTGSTLGSMLDAWATMVSIGLQYGVPLDAIAEKFKHWKFEPAGVTYNHDIPMCSSPLDYVAKWLEHRFLEPSQNSETTEEDEGLRGSMAPPAPTPPPFDP